MADLYIKKQLEKLQKSEIEVGDLMSDKLFLSAFTHDGKVDSSALKGAFELAMTGKIDEAVSLSGSQARTATGDIGIAGLRSTLKNLHERSSSSLKDSQMSIKNGFVPNKNALPFDELVKEVIKGGELNIPFVNIDSEADLASYLTQASFGQPCFNNTDSNLFNLNKNELDLVKQVQSLGFSFSSCSSAEELSDSAKNLAHSIFKLHKAQDDLKILFETKKNSPEFNNKFIDLITLNSSSLTNLTTLSMHSEINQAWKGSYSEFVSDLTKIDRSKTTEEQTEYIASIKEKSSRSFDVKRYTAYDNASKQYFKTLIPFLDTNSVREAFGESAFNSDGTINEDFYDNIGNILISNKGTCLLRPDIYDRLFGSTNGVFTNPNYFSNNEKFSSKDIHYLMENPTKLLNETELFNFGSTGNPLDDQAMSIISSFVRMDDALKRRDTILRERVLTNLEIPGFGVPEDVNKFKEISPIGYDEVVDFYKEHSLRTQALEKLQNKVDNLDFNNSKNLVDKLFSNSKQRAEILQLLSGGDNEKSVAKDLIKNAYLEHGKATINVSTYNGENLMLGDKALDFDGITVGSISNDDIETKISDDLRDAREKTKGNSDSFKKSREAKPAPDPKKAELDAEAKREAEEKWNKIVSEKNAELKNSFRDFISSNMRYWVFLYGKENNVRDAAGYAANYFKKLENLQSQHKTTGQRFTYNDGSGELFMKTEEGIHRDATNSNFSKASLATLIQNDISKGLTDGSIDLAISDIRRAVMRGSVTIDALNQMLGDKKFQKYMGLDTNGDAYALFMEKLGKEGLTTTSMGATTEKKNLLKKSRVTLDVNPEGLSEVERFKVTFTLMKNAKFNLNEEKLKNSDAEAYEKYIQEKDAFYKEFIRERFFNTDGSKINAKDMKMLFADNEILKDASPAVQAWYNETLKDYAKNNTIGYFSPSDASEKNEGGLLPDVQKFNFNVQDYLGHLKNGLGYIPCDALTDIEKYATDKNLQAEFNNDPAVQLYIGEDENKVYPKDLIEVHGIKIGNEATPETKAYYEKIIRDEALARMEEGTNCSSKVEGGRFGVIHSHKGFIPYTVDMEIADRKRYGLEQDGRFQIDRDEIAFLEENSAIINQLRITKAYMLQNPNATTILDYKDINDEEKTDIDLNEYIISPIVDRFIQKFDQTNQTQENLGNFIRQVTHNEGLLTFGNNISVENLQNAIHQKLHEDQIPLVGGENMQYPMIVEPLKLGNEIKIDAENATPTEKFVAEDSKELYTEFEINKALYEKGETQVANVNGTRAIKNLSLIGDENAFSKSTISTVLKSIQDLSKIKDPALQQVKLLSIQDAVVRSGLSNYFKQSNTAVSQLGDVIDTLKAEMQDKIAQISNNPTKQTAVQNNYMAICKTLQSTLQCNASPKQIEQQIQNVANSKGFRVDSLTTRINAEISNLKPINTNSEHTMGDEGM